MFKTIKHVKVKRQSEIDNDHLLVVKEMFATEKFIKEEKRKKIIKEKIKSHKLKEDAKNVYHEKVRESLILEGSNTGLGVEHKWNYFKQRLLKAAKESCSVITKLYTKKSKWWTSAIQNSKS